LSSRDEILGRACSLSPLILPLGGSGPSGEWSDDDYDVLADGAVVGRVMLGRG
jgi:hypothetical protein